MEGGAPANSPTREAIKEKVRELANLSRDLEVLTRQLGAASSTVQVGFLKERVDQLTATQRKLIGEIAVCCPDLELKAEFEGLDTRLETVRQLVKDCKDGEELETLRQEIDPLVERWADTFQRLVVATVQGATAA